MLPFDNKNEILFLLDMEEGTTLERTDAVVRRIESALASQPEVINYVSTVGASGPIDFNGMVRHYYLRSRPFQAEVRANFVGKKNRAQQSHGIGLRLRDELEALAKFRECKNPDRRTATRSTRIGFTGCGSLWLGQKRLSRRFKFSSNRIRSYATGAGCG